MHLSLEVNLTLEGSSLSLVFVSWRCHVVRCGHGGKKSSMVAVKHTREEKMVACVIKRGFKKVIATLKHLGNGLNCEWPSNG